MRSKLSEAAAAMGRKGGKTKGATKSRGTTEHYRALGLSRWAGMSAEERSLEMSRRRRLGVKRKA